MAQAIAWVLDRAGLFPQMGAAILNEYQTGFGEERLRAAWADVYHGI